MLEQVNEFIKEFETLIQDARDQGKDPPRSTCSFPWSDSMEEILEVSWESAVVGHGMATGRRCGHSFLFGLFLTLKTQTRLDTEH